MCCFAGVWMQFRRHVFFNSRRFWARMLSFAENVLLGMLFAFTLAPWGTIERSRGPSAHKKGDVGVQAWILSILGEFPNRIWGVVGDLWINKCVFCYSCLQVTFFNDFGVCFTVSGLQNQAFGVRRDKENNISHVFGFCEFRCHLYMFLMALGFLFDDFGCLGDMLEIS